MALSGSARIVDLIFRGDSVSAVAAMEAITDSSATTRDAIADDSAEEAASMDDVRDSTARLRDSMIGLAGIVGIGAVTFGLKDLVEGGETLQRNQMELAATLRATGNTAKDAESKMESFAQTLSTKGGYAINQYLPALIQFDRITGSVTKSEQLLSLATEIGRARNMSLSQAVTLVTRAYSGQTRGLQQLLGPMGSTTAAAVKLSLTHETQLARVKELAAYMNGPYKSILVNQAELQYHLTAAQIEAAQVEDKRLTGVQLLNAAEKAFAGSTSTYNATSTGKISDLDNASKNLNETLGEKLLPGVNAITSVMKSMLEELTKAPAIIYTVTGVLTLLAIAFGIRAVIKAFNGLINDTRSGLQRVGLMSKETVPAIEETGTAADAAGTQMEMFSAAEVDASEQGRLFEATNYMVAASEDMAGASADAAAVSFGAMMVAALPMIALFVAISAAVYLLSTHFSLVKRIAVDAAEWVYKEWKKLPFVVQLFISPLLALITHMKEIIHLAAQVGGAIGHAFGGVGHFIGGLFSEGGPVPRYLAGGGPVKPRYLAEGGPQGTDTVPAYLTPGEGVLSTEGMHNLAVLNSGQFNRGATGAMSITPGKTVVRIGAREVAEAVTQYVLDRAARGPSNLVGGSLVTGAPGLP